MNMSADPSTGQQRQQRRSNLRLALALASVAVVFFAGFVTKIVLLGR